MFQLSVIILCSLTVLLLHFFISDDGLLSPRSAYALSFLPATLLLYLYVEKWDVDLELSTVFVIIIGLVVFTISSLVTEKIKIRKISPLNERVEKLFVNRKEEKKKEIETWKYIFFIIFQLITLYLLYGYIRSIVGGGSFLAVMNKIRQKTVAEYINIPTIISIMRSICLASRFIWMYLLIYITIYKTGSIRTKLLLLVNLAIGIIISMLLGGRGNLVDAVVVGWILYYAISGTIGEKGRRVQERKKCYVYVTIIAVLGLISFQSLGRLVGRNLKYNNLDYFAVYLSAPIKNLDTFIRESGNSILFLEGISNKLNTNQTLATVLNYVAIKFGITDLYHTRDLTVALWPDRRIHGYYLGNCYTTYAPYLYDGGWFAVILFTALHAVICQSIYNFALKTMARKNHKRGMVPLIVYSEVWYYTFFSFFTDMFYFSAVGIGFLRSVIYLIIISWFLYNVNIGERHT
ncbi:oligosaccharide repeat unit polymerase [Clostridiaceae bacterium]|nr:oligosaccharide repeat unit polymerase [Clostridiaceae bacterium]RKI12932.1 oligosaccharide repeat unit polymerase [bacterium 1XD21-70]